PPRDDRSGRTAAPCRDAAAPRPAWRAAARCGSSCCSARPAPPCGTPPPPRRGCRPSSPSRPGGTPSPRRTRPRAPRPRSGRQSAICCARSTMSSILLLAAYADGLAAASVEIGDLDRLDPDLQNPILAQNDLAFGSVNRRAATVAEHGHLLLRGRRLDGADELQRNRRRRRRRRRSG